MKLSMFRAISLRWLTNVLGVRRCTFLVAFIFLIGLFNNIYKHGRISLCQSRVHKVTQSKTRGNTDSYIDPRVLAELKKRWLVEYEEEKRLNENGKSAGKANELGGQSNTSRFHSIDCLVNKQSTVHCLKDSKQNIYMPWSFLESYFEIYGQLKHGGGYDRFEFSQSYAKVVYKVGKQYKFDGGFLTFEKYRVQLRNRVKCITGVEGVPLSTQWGPQGYFYPIQIAQYGLSHFSKYLIEGPPKKTVYEDGGLAVQGKWNMSDRHCEIENIYDKERRSRVIKFSASVNLPHNMGVYLPLGNTMEYELAFDIKFNTKGCISVLLETTLNKQFFLHYVTDNKLLEYDKETNIAYGIGNRLEWSHISRDLLTDLKKGVALTNTKNSKNISIRKIVRFILRGEGYINNITIQTTDHMTHFFDASEWLLSNQDQETGGWPIMVKRSLRGFPPLVPGWQSAMAQGHGLSTMVRAYKTTLDKRYIIPLRKAIRPYTVSSKDGGVRAIFMKKYVWYEEYPTTPSNFVLNGFIFSLLGLYDFKMLLKWEKQQQNRGGRKFTEEDEKALNLTSELFDTGMTSLKNMLPLYDTGSRTIYDLKHLVLKVQPNIARWDYHTTHMTQIAALATIDDDPIFMRFFNYWNDYKNGKHAQPYLKLIG